MSTIKIPQSSINFFKSNVDDIFNSGNMAEGVWIEKLTEYATDYCDVKFATATVSNGTGMMSLLQIFKFVKDVGYRFNDVYLPILSEQKDKYYSENNREFQLYRRGRYVEFNLVYDRGTLFGLETQGRIESILMSLPPLTSWTYDWSPEPNSAEAKLYDVIEPKDWVNL